MYEFIKANQLNIMLVLTVICLTMAFLLFIARFLPKKRKSILIAMELVAAFLVYFDRVSYLYAGNLTRRGYVMIRLANFMVFFLTSCIILVFNIYIADLIKNDSEEKRLPIRMIIVGILALVWMLLATISAFTGLYYHFDENNNYVRGKAFILCILVPVICPIIQFTVVIQERKRISKKIYFAIIFYIFVPVIMGIVQVFDFGISIVNMAMALVSILLYVLTVMDSYDEVEKKQKLGLDNLKAEGEEKENLFDEMANALVNTAEISNPKNLGRAKRVANLAKMIASYAGMNDEEIKEAYYSGLLCNVGMIRNAGDDTENLLLTDYDKTARNDKSVKKDNSVKNGDTAKDKLINDKVRINADILSNIKGRPYLSRAAKSCMERFDGKGYPNGLKGNDIPWQSRIVAISDAYISLRDKKNIKSDDIREFFVKKSGELFDPDYTKIMIDMIDKEKAAEADEEFKLEKNLVCREYRQNNTIGVQALSQLSKISFKCRAIDEENGFSAPSLILFDSFDGRTHSDEKTITAYRYIEYGELWFDGNYISTNARNMEVTSRDRNADKHDPENYSVIMSRYDDHVKLVLKSAFKMVEAIIALPDQSKAFYISLSGENCDITDIELKTLEQRIKESDIRRIADVINYVDRIESDLPNVQINRNRSAYTEGLLLNKNMRLLFHDMALPSAQDIWNCPYIVLYYSEDKKVNGKGYKEYALIKLNGESEVNNKEVENDLAVEKNDSFPGWDIWKERQKKGIECSVDIAKKGREIIVYSENLGLTVRNRSLIANENEVYVAVTGDQIAITDIRIIFMD